MILNLEKNLDIDSGNEDDITTNGANIFYPTAARTIDIVSDSIQDDMTTGTGAWKIRIKGLDINYAPQQEDIELNGTSNVTSSNSYLRLFRAECLDCGSGGVNAGNITTTYNVDSQIALKILAGEGQTQFAALTVPANKIMMPLNFKASIIKTSGSVAGVRAAIVQVYIREYNESSTNNYNSWKQIFNLMLNQDGTSVHDTYFYAINNIPAKSDVRVTGTARTNDTAIWARLQYHLIDE